MNSSWTKRGLRGAKYLAFGVFSVLVLPLATRLVQGNLLGMIFVELILGGIGPLMFICGIYLVVTRDKKE